MFLVNRFRKFAEAWSELGLAARIAATLCLTVTFGGHAISLYQRTFTQQQMIIEVRLNDAAPECYPPLQQRSYKPMLGGGFCGLVFTAQGYFKLPETRLWHIAAAPREALHAQLQQGCRYEVTVIRTGRLTQEIHDITRRLGCGDALSA